MAHGLEESTMGSRTKVERPAHDKDPRSTLVVGGLQVMPQGYSVSVYLREDGQYVQEVNGRRVELHAWVGVQLEADLLGKDWKRADITKYEPSGLMGWLHRKERKDEQH